MADNFTRHNKDFEHVFNEQSSLFMTANAVRHAFLEGFTCFVFRFKFHERVFEDRFALRPEIHDESDAFELGEFAFWRFENALQRCMSKT